MLQGTHRRTCCVYCGTRISGRYEYGLHPATPAERRVYRWLARFACPQHLTAARNDPELPCS